LDEFTTFGTGKLQYEKHHISHAMLSLSHCRSPLTAMRLCPSSRFFSANQQL